MSDEQVADELTALVLKVERELFAVREQLAAEREAFGSAMREVNELREQLAAERAKLKEALHLLAMSRFDAGDDESVNRETALLAKVNQQNWIRAEDNPGFHRHE